MGAQWKHKGRVAAADARGRLFSKLVKEIIIAGFKSAFLPYREKADLLAEITAELAKIKVPANGKTREVVRPAPSEVQRAGAPTSPDDPRPSTDILRQ